MTSLADLLFGGDEDGSALLLHEGGRDHSLSEVRARAEVIARHLEAAGVHDGTPVGVMLPNADVVPALFAVWRAGGAYVPLNPRLGASDLAHVLETVQPSVVVTVPEHLDRFGSEPIVVLDDEVTTRPGAVGSRRYDPGVALIQLTSGTTGRPKR